jgi:hypothetical protein
MEFEEVGSGARNDRPSWQRLLDAARWGQLDVVVVWNLGCAGRPTLDRLASIEALQGLDIGTTMEQVQALLDAPDAADQSTCGAGFGKPWSCRSWTYGNECPRFKVWFQMVSGRWTVDNWSS